MKAVNAASSDGGVPLTVLGPELAYKHAPGMEDLAPFPDACKDYIDIVSRFTGIHTAAERRPAAQRRLRSTAR